MAAARKLQRLWRAEDLPWHEELLVAAFSGTVRAMAEMVLVCEAHDKCGAPPAGEHERRQDLKPGAVQRADHSNTRGAQ